MKIRIRISPRKTKTLKSVAALLQRCGWTIAGGTKHRKWRCPCGEHTVVIAVSPSCRKAEQNQLHDAMKCNSVREKVA